MMRTSELTGAMLDYWVARAERIEHPPYLREMSPGCCLVPVTEPNDGGTTTRWVAYQPSTDWSVGGPLIDNYRIGFGIYEPGERGYFACTGINDSHGVGTGPDHLIAACRAVVQAVFGDEVQEGSESNG